MSLNGKRYSYYWLVVFSIAAFMRLWKLDLRPPHFDEAVNGLMVDHTLPLLGYYKYDPQKFHGPLHFYVLFISKFIFGDGLWPLRLPSVIFGLATIVLAYLYRVMIGEKTALYFGIFLAFSPGLIYYSRDAIHETSFLFFSMLFFFSATALQGQLNKRQLWGLCAGFTGMVLLKETWVLNFTGIALALTLRRYYFSVAGDGGEKPSEAARPRVKATQYVLACGVMLFITTLLYSGFWKNPRGVIDFFLAFKFWLSRGMSVNAATQPFYFWFKVLFSNELIALVGFFAAGYVVLAKKNYGAVIFCASVYSLILLTAYSGIRYKTPWCALQLIWPLQLISAAFFVQLQNTFNRHKPFRKKALALVLILLNLASLAQAVTLNYLSYDDPRELYVFYQTRREAVPLWTKVLLKAQGASALYHQPLRFFLNNRWPLPWVFKNFDHQTSDPNVGSDDVDGLFLVVAQDRKAKLEAKLKCSYFVVQFELDTHQGQMFAYYNSQVFAQTFVDNDKAVLFTPLSVKP